MASPMIQPIPIQIRTGRTEVGGKTMVVLIVDHAAGQGAYFIPQADSVAIGKQLIELGEAPPALTIPQVGGLILPTNGHHHV